MVLRKCNGDMLVQRVGELWQTKEKAGPGEACQLELHLLNYRPKRRRP
jgi:hypothetical protein